MKTETLYDVKKHQNDEIKKNYKERRKVINKEIREVQFDRKNVILSIISLLVGVGGITFGINSEKLMDHEILAMLIYSLSGVCIGGSPMILIDIENTDRQQKIEKLIEKRNEIDELIIKQRITREDKKTLKKQLVITNK